MRHTRFSELSFNLAIAQARLQSLTNGGEVVYIHYFPVDGQYMVTPMKGSKKFLHSAYVSGKQIQIAIV